MTQITVYDSDAKKIKELCDEWGVPAADLIEAIVHATDLKEIDLEDWL